MALDRTDPSPLPRSLSLQAGVLDLDSGTWTPARPDAELTRIEIDLLACLVLHAPEPVTREALLQEVWGYAPTTQTRTLDTTMRRLRRKLELRPSEPYHLRTLRGVGYAFQALPAWELEGGVSSAPVEEEDPLAVLPDTGFVGRSRELAWLNEQRGRLVTLVGPAGVGKSRLAKQHVRFRPPESVRIVHLPEASLPEDLLGALATALAIRPAGTSTEEALKQIGDGLRAMDLRLLVLDGADSLVAHLRAALPHWLQRAPACRFVLSSRQRLRLEVEQVLQVEPLAEEDALQLLSDRAGRDLSSDGAARELVAQVEGLPLSLELVGSWLHRSSAAAIVDELAGQDRGPMLLTLESTLTRFLRASFERLAPFERDVLAQCATLPPAFSARAAVHALDLAHDPTAPDALDALTLLVDKSLVQEHWSRGRSPRRRYTLFDSVREFAVASFPEVSGEARRRFDAWLLEAAGRRVAELHGRHGAHHRRWLRRESRSLVAMVRGRMKQDAQMALRGLVLAAEPLLDLGLQLEVIGLATALQRVAEGLEPDEWRRLTGLRARALIAQGLPFDALEALAQVDIGETIAMDAELALLQANALLYTCETDPDRLPECAERFEAAVALARRLAPARTVRNALRDLGRMYHRMGAFERADALLEEALVLAEAAEDTDLLAKALSALGSSKCKQGELQAGKAYLMRAIAADEQLERQQGLMSDLANLGMVCVRLGDNVVGHRLLERALGLAETMEHVRGQAYIALYLAAAGLSLGDSHLAIVSSRRAVGHFEDIGVTWGRGIAWAFLAMARAEHGQARAVEAWREAQDALAMPEADASTRGDALLALAEAVVRGDASLAGDRLHNVSFDHPSTLLDVAQIGRRVAARVLGVAAAD